MLADEDKLDWDQPVREYLPGFTMYDRFATERLTPRDLAGFWRTPTARSKTNSSAAAPSTSGADHLYKLGPGRNSFDIALRRCVVYICSMIDEEKIKQVAERIGQATNAEQVILFGSHARGEATEHSDVDLLVVAESNLPRFKRSRQLYRSLRPYPFGMDLVIYTPEEIEKACQSPLSFVSTALREGKTVYVR